MIAVPVDHIQRREDVLVSVCLVGLGSDERTFSEVETLALTLDGRFRFREIVLVALAADCEAFLPLVRRVTNLRLFLVREGMSIYHQRAIAASEAIGDIVLIAGAGQFDALDHVGMIEKASAEDRIVVGLRHGPAEAGRVLSLALVAAGHVAGFRAGLTDSATMALPRALLNQLLDHTDPDLALRFVPRDPALPATTFAAKSGNASSYPDGARHIVRRFELLYKLVVHMAPRILVTLTLVSGLLTLLGLIFTVYVIGVWAFKPTVEPGWLTICAMLSLTSTFLGMSVFGLSIASQRIIALLRRDGLGAEAHEVNRIDLLGQVANQLNVDIDRGHE